MKERLDLVRGWLHKAQSDLRALDASLGAGAFDAACFHAQQAAEKYLKAFLIFAGVDFPLTHNLAKLVELCAEVDSSLHALLPAVEPLTPYAVELRYDTDFWPDEQVAREARASALQVKNLVLGKLPSRAARRVQHFPAGYDLSDRFPDRRRMMGAEGGVVYEAERDGMFYLIVDEGTLADLLPPEDQDMIDILIQVLEFDDADGREQYLREKGWDRFRGRWYGARDDEW